MPGIGHKQQAATRSGDEPMTVWRGARPGHPNVAVALVRSSPIRTIAPQAERSPGTDTAATGVRTESAGIYALREGESMVEARR